MPIWSEFWTPSAIRLLGYHTRQEVVTSGLTKALLAPKGGSLTPDWLEGPRFSVHAVTPLRSVRERVLQKRVEFATCCKRSRVYNAVVLCSDGCIWIHTQSRPPSTASSLQEKEKTFSFLYVFNSTFTLFSQYKK